MKSIWIPQIVVIPMLLWAMKSGNPYGYYMLLRFVCCGVFAYLAYEAFERDKQVWTWILGITAALYNPIIRVHLSRDIWAIVNIVTVCIAIASIFIFKANNKKL